MSVDKEISKITICRRDMNSLFEHAREGYPEEVCGILAGNDYVVKHVYRMTNTEHSPVSYFMDPSEQFRVMKDLRERGLRMVGIYHSHPDSPAYPSAKDVSLAFYDDAVYVIISLMDGVPTCKGFSIREGDVKEVEIDVIEEE